MTGLSLLGLKDEVQAVARVREIPPGKSEMHALMRAFDWGASALGPPSSWPQSLCTLVNLMLESPIPMCVVWGPELRLLYNDACLPLAGPKHPAVLAATLRDAAPEIWERIGPMVQRALSGEPCLTEDVRIDATRNGSTSRAWFTLSYTPVRNEQGDVEGVLCIGSETTQRVQMERWQAFRLSLSDELRDLSDAGEIIARASRMLGQHLRATRVGYAQVDEAQEQLTVVRDWTQGALPALAGQSMKLDAFGESAASQLKAGRALTIDDVAHDARPVSRVKARLGVGAALVIPLIKNGRLCALFRIHHAGAHPWSEDEVVRAQDTAERTWAALERANAEEQRRIAEAALRAERDQSQYIFDSMTEGFAMLDPDCTLVQMNAEGRRIGQVSMPDVIGRKVWEIFPKVVNSRLQDLYHDVMVTGKGASIEYPRQMPDEKVTWIEVRAYPALDGGLAVFYRDINERKQAEEKLKQTDRRKDEFLAMLAHELRNPLAPIAAAAELLSGAQLDAQDVKHSSEVIARQVGHMTSLVNDLLDVSRVTGGLVSIERLSVDINEILSEAVEQVGPLIRARAHHLSVHAAPVPARVSGDRMRLVQVLANLLNNAAKYTPAGGQITVRVELRDGQVALLVRDNGIGMAPDLVESAFELFAQAQKNADRTEGGLGIGLALVRAIVELHGGRVTARSDGIGHGTELLVLLPQAGEEPLAEGRPVDLQRVPAPLAALKVLVVDDNVDAGHTLGMLMKVAGHRAFVEHQAEHALERARLLQPDVCLLDIGLPGMNGNELARRLRAQPQTAHSVLIAVTGYGPDPHGPGAVAPEFDHHLVKPIETGRLLALLRQMGAH